MSKNKIDYSVLDNICRRALYYSTQMIYLANNRKDKAKGDPKIGGHPAACASYLHIAAAMHLVVKTGFDHLAVKPHASPMDHSFNFMLDLLLESNLDRFDDEKAKQAMHGLRAYSKNGEPVFQSYHSAYDPDFHNFLPSGTVGIPPVQLGYMAHAYRMLKDNGFEVPHNAHFWALMGDSEYREGSLQEALPDFAERELGNLTWIVDYNRQSLDGHRITNKEIMNGTDNERIARTAEASGWDVIQVRHGKKRLAVFAKEGGKELQEYFETQLEDFELQTFLRAEDMKAVRKKMLEENKNLKTILDSISDEELKTAITDLGGHDLEEIISALIKSKEDPRRPCLVIIHTLKGWGLESAAEQANHNTMVGKAEVNAIRELHNIPENDLFQKFAADSKEAKFLKARGDELYDDIQVQNGLKQENINYFRNKMQEFGEIPDELDINLKLVTYPHTQWMLGQLTSKLNRIANTTLNEKELKEKQKPLTDIEKKWKAAAEMIVSMAPDVGTSTNLNPSMDGQIYDPEVVEDYESEFNLKDTKSPDLIPSEEKAHKFIRFEIEEQNAMSCVGSYGIIREVLGIPILPLMTVYDFFVKRALDQHFYNLYWKSSFILVGTPAGVTLSPEGAQHGWKSDIQIPNQITWEPYFCQELDWIMSDAIKRHVCFDNEGRTGVHIRNVTRGADQKEFLKRLMRQTRFKASSNGELAMEGFELGSATLESSVATISEAEIMTSIKHDVLNGAYYLVDYKGYAGYEPGDNVVNIFAMGATVTEALKASDLLLARGIYANVIVVTSSDLLVGNLAHNNEYFHLKHGLNIDTNLHLVPSDTQSTAELVSIAGRKIPAVSVHDGEPGLLDNIGSVLGVRHETLAVRKHSKCGRPQDIYAFHNIDENAIVDSVGKVLSENAMEEVKVNRSLLESLNGMGNNISHWRELWPQQIQK